MDVSKGDILSNDVLLTAYDNADKVIKTAVSVILTAKIGKTAMLFSWASRMDEKTVRDSPNGGIIYVGSESMAVELMGRSFELFDNMSQPEAAKLAVIIGVASELSGVPMSTILEEMSARGNSSQN